MATVTVNITRQEEIVINFPCYLKNASGTEMVVYNDKQQGIEIAENGIKKAELNLKENFKYYSLATKKEFYSLFEKTKSNINSLLIMASDVDSLPQPQGKSEVEPESNKTNVDIEDWAEAHFEICESITIALSSSADKNIAKRRQEEQGRGGVYELSFELTNKFLKENSNIIWGEDKIFQDEIDSFIEKEIFSKK